MAVAKNAELKQESTFGTFPGAAETVTVRAKNGQVASAFTPYQIIAALALA
jgi:hypothetical protein